MHDAWSPGLYERFSQQRDAPFYDLLALVQGRRQASVVDLGCGTGRLTFHLHNHVRARATLGLDSSLAMLAEASRFRRESLKFEQADIGEFKSGQFDLVFSNASLQWLPDHERALAGWTQAVRPGGELAFQVPANADHPSHVLAAEVANESPFREAFPERPPPDPVLSVLTPEQYSELLHALGYSRQHVRLQVYGMELSSTADIVAWMRGTSLTRFRSVLSDGLFKTFLKRYRSRLLETLGDLRPYFYTYKRILAWGEIPVRSGRQEGTTK